MTQPARRVLALVLAVALGAGGLLLAASPTDAADPPSGTATISGGYVDWGVRASFRSYITGPIANGTITTADGASTNGDGTFHFGDARGATDGGVIDAAVDGAVRFTGHDGQLDMTIAAVRVELEGAASVLRADVVSRSLDTGESTTYDDVVFATLDPTSITPTDLGGSFRWTAVPATLTAAGSAAFADFYAAGTPLDPVTLTLSFGEDPPPTTESTTSTTAPTTPTTPTTVDPHEEVDPHGERTATGAGGQTLTVRPADGLDPNGQAVEVTGTGYDESLGIYLSFCVDRGPNLAPSPCLGGVDLSGTSGSSVWISSNPPPYGVGLAHPFGAGGTFEETLTIQAVDTDDEGNVLADCYDPDTRCVVTTRADHTDAEVRSADVKVPVYFAGQTPPDDTTPGAPWVSVTPSSVRPGALVDVTGGGFLAGEQVEVWLHSEPEWIATVTADADGAIAHRFTLPLDTPAGSHAVELRSLSGVSVTSAAFTVLAADTSAGRTTSGTLPATGADSGTLVGLASLLVLAGATLTFVSRGSAARGSSRGRPGG